MVSTNNTICLCRITLMKMLVGVVKILILWLNVNVCFAGDPYYAAEWSDVIRSCPDFDNTHFSCDDLELGSAGDGEEGGLSLSGKLTFLEDIEEGYVMDLEIMKCTELGEEPMYSARGDFCGSLKNPDTPWYPLVLTFNSSSCPIRKDEYSLDGLTISMDFAKDVLSHEFCGEYKAQLAMMLNMEMMSCHMLSLAVVEKYDDEE